MIESSCFRDLRDQLVRRVVDSTTRVLHQNLEPCAHHTCDRHEGEHEMRRIINIL
jgi:hypothetical protein